MSYSNLDRATQDAMHDNLIDKLERDEWKPMDSAPRTGITIEGNYGTPEKPEICLIRWSDNPVCMLVPRNGSFPPGWATAPESDTDTNLPADMPNSWREF